MAIADVWPLAALAIDDGAGLVLRWGAEGDVAALAAVARDGVHAPDVMPFMTPWSAAGPAERAASALRWRWRWRCAADWSADTWSLPLVVMVDDVVVGSQTLSATSFAVVRRVATGSWLGQAHQGRGIGTRMRRAVLSFAFDHLGAGAATTTAWVDNAASLAVTARLGYRHDGTDVEERGGKAVECRRFVLPVQEWRAAGHPPVTVTGLDRCRGWLDARHPQWPDDNR